MVGVQVSLTTERWRYLPRRPDDSIVPFGHALRYQLVGYLGNFVLPARMGQLLRSDLVARYEAMVLAQTIGTAVLDGPGHRDAGGDRLRRGCRPRRARLGRAGDGLVAGAGVVAIVILATVSPARLLSWLHRLVGRGAACEWRRGWVMSIVSREACRRSADAVHWRSPRS